MLVAEYRSTVDCSVYQPELYSASINERVLRTPLFFQTQEEPLFGWYHAPKAVSTSNLGVVICPPLGHEYVHSHRSMRHLADHFASAGMPAFRFDYHGIGDSSGTDEDDKRLEAWLNSIKHAITTLKSISGCEAVGLVGFRMGATLAAMVASEVDVACLVLWAPLVRARQYIRELKVLQASGETNGLSSQQDIEGAGFIFTPQTAEQLSAINLKNIVPLPTPVFIGGRDDLADDYSLRDSWTEAGLCVDYRRLTGYADMLVETHYTKVPLEAIGEVISWVLQFSESGYNVNCTVSPEYDCKRVFLTQRTYIKQPLPEVHNIFERIIQFGDTNRLFGIISEPEPKDSIKDFPIVILLNPGSVHHVGSNRLYVLLARTLAQAGFRCLRMDVTGIGDSIIDNESKENDPYVATASDDIKNAITALNNIYGESAFVVMGLCSGAHASFHAGLDIQNTAIKECYLINPLTFYWKDGMSLETSPTKHYSSWGYYKQTMRKKDRWIKLLTGRSEYKAIIGSILMRIRILSQIFAKKIIKKLVPSTVQEDDLSGDILKIVGTGTQLSFLLSDTDPGYDLLMTNAKRTVKKLLAQRKTSIVFIHNSDHTFTLRAARQDMMANVVQHLLGRYANKPDQGVST